MCSSDLDVPDNEVLEELFQMFNLSRPQDFEGHSQIGRASCRERV